MAPTSCFTGQVHRLPDAPEAYGAMITRPKAAPAQSRSADLTRITELASQHRKNITKHLPHFCLTELDLLDSIHIGKKLDPLFDHCDGAWKSELSLEETEFVNNILPCTHFPGFGRVFTGEDEQGKGAPLQHFLKDIPNGVPRSSTCFISLH